MDKPAVPEKVTIVIDPVSKPVGLVKDIAKGIEKIGKDIEKSAKQTGKKIKKAFKIK